MIPASWKFFLLVVLAYVAVLVFDISVFVSSMTFFYSILLKILPVFVIVFVLMAITNHYVTPNFVMKHMGGKGPKKWIYVILGGIISSGPIYMWYPLLAELREKKLSYGLIACFLYNRAIKIPLLPVAVFYFGWAYVLVLSAVMITMSIVQAILIDNLMGVEK